MFAETAAPVFVSQAIFFSYSVPLSSRIHLAYKCAALDFVVEVDGVDAAQVRHRYFDFERVVRAVAFVLVHVRVVIPLRCPFDLRPAARRTGAHSGFAGPSSSIAAL